ncbi:hypothetical protein CsatB_026324 [Cannabis sativa]|uniref:Photosynthetic NDH subunit of subcomplex B 5, chloroplastic n=1 Tax=Cannabis sativa TaxID=3483 RepID=A0A803Q147_CANSA|nr:photosynthetic NDH subunit of subcomplex B 5, chloroplastic [Cannabis sativa]
MAAQSCSIPLLSSPTLPKFSPYSSEASTRVSIPSRKFLSSSWRLNATGFSEIEPDLNEDPVDRWATNSVSAEDFVYGVYDGHHTFHEGEDNKGTFWEALSSEIASVDPPTGFQGLISWLFLPAVAAGMYFNAPGEYVFIGAGLFTVVFCIIEMDKPDKPHHFEPQIYNMERGARDKLISDYNTMDIWDFNEKYGDLWDFTIKKDSTTIKNR